MSSSIKLGMMLNGAQHRFQKAIPPVDQKKKKNNTQKQFQNKDITSAYRKGAT